MCHLPRYRKQWVLFHLNSSHGSASKIILTVVCYLNERRDRYYSGALTLFHSQQIRIGGCGAHREKIEDVVPFLDPVAVFGSEKVEHKVKYRSKERSALIFWFYSILLMCDG